MQEGLDRHFCETEDRGERSPERQVSFASATPDALSGINSGFCKVRSRSEDVWSAISALTPVLLRQRLGIFAGVARHSLSASRRLRPPEKSIRNLSYRSRGEVFASRDGAIRR